MRYLVETYLYQDKWYKIWIRFLRSLSMAAGGLTWLSRVLQCVFSEFYLPSYYQLTGYEPHAQRSTPSIFIDAPPPNPHLQLQRYLHSNLQTLSLQNYRVHVLHPTRISQFSSHSLEVVPMGTIPDLLIQCRPWKTPRIFASPGYKRKSSSSP